MTTCPCCSGKPYQDCCAPYIEKKQFPVTPEALMRSRYTAYSQANIDYIADTMKAPANQNFNRKEAFEWASHVTWLGLQVVRAETQGNIGFVEFIARFEEDQQKEMLSEHSEFRKDDGRWYYVAGKPLTLKLGRNEPCYCASGKKYKACCGK